MDPRTASPGSESSTAQPWCDCPDAPLFARGAATVIDHPGGCEFPEQVCTRRAHRVTVHEGCGRELRVRFCGCPPSGYTLDPERGWWVHYTCGWPTRALYEGTGRPAPQHLAGLRPVTYHEFAVVPRSPKSAYERLTMDQRRINHIYAGTWVRD
jgi:hypothetical protein